MVRQRTFSMAILAAALIGVAGCDSAGTTSTELPAPILLGPIDGATFSALSLVEFSWAPVDDAAFYEIAIEFDDYPSANVAGVISDTVHVDQLAELGIVRWRVRGRTDETAGIWSETRLMEVEGTPVTTTGEYNFRFSTDEATVGQNLVTLADEAFASRLLSAIQASGAAAPDVRGITVESFVVSIENPRGATLDDFSEWNIFLTRAADEEAIMTITDPAPAAESSDVVFLQPDAWLSLASSTQTALTLSLRTNPRTPRSTDVHVRATIQMNAALNH